jgi:hypothetical protein
LRIIAVDWSGRAAGERRAIWLAEARDGDIVRVENGRTRAQIAEHLVDLARDDGELVVGLDFSFSLPAWFLEDHGHATAAELWDEAAREGERWLRECRPPFWGRPGHARPALRAAWRVTEAVSPAFGGVRPKSTFQIGGAGSVGTGAVRGFPVLARLRAAGFAIWPFDPARPPFVLEVWPRACTGPVVKSRAEARAEYLDACLPNLWAVARNAAIESEDAFDAVVTAIVMEQHRAQLFALPPAPHPAAALEGWTWMP